MGYTYHTYVLGSRKKRGWVILVWREYINCCFSDKAVGIWGVCLVLDNLRTFIGTILQTMVHAFKAPVISQIDAQQKTWLTRSKFKCGRSWSDFASCDELMPSSHVVYIVPPKLNSFPCHHKKVTLKRSPIHIFGTVQLFQKFVKDSIALELDPSYVGIPGGRCRVSCWQMHLTHWWVSTIGISGGRYPIDNSA